MNFEVKKLEVALRVIIGEQRKKKSYSSFLESLGLLGASTVDHVCERPRKMEVSFFLEYKKEKEKRPTLRNVVPRGKRCTRRL